MHSRYCQSSSHAPAPLHSGAESGHHARVGARDRLHAADGQPLSRGYLRGPRRTHSRRCCRPPGPDAPSSSQPPRWQSDFSALLTVPISEIRSIGVAGFLVAAISVLLANTLVPALLALLGSHIDAGRLPFTPRLDADRTARTGARWRQWGQGHRGSTLACHPDRRHATASARVAGPAARHQPAQKATGFHRQPSRCMPCTLWSVWIAPGSCNRCASSSNCPIRSRKRTRAGTRSIASPNSSPATRAAIACFLSPPSPRATAPHSPTFRARRGERS